MPRIIEMEVGKRRSYTVDASGRLYESFGVYRGLIDIWDQMLFPEGTPGLRTLGSVVASNAPKPIVKEKSTYITNWPMTRMLAVVNRLMLGKPHFVPHLEGDLEQRHKRELLAKAAVGLMNHLDDQEQAYQRGYSWDRSMKTMVASLSKVIQRIHVGPRGVNVELLDPYGCAHSLDTPWGSREFTQHFTIKVRELESFVLRLKGARTAEEVRDGIGKEKLAAEDDDLDVVDYWLEEEEGKNIVVYNAVLIANEPVFPEVARRTGFAHRPILVHASGASARRFGRLPGQEKMSRKDVQVARHAVPFYAPALIPIQIAEMVLGLGLDNLAMAVDPPRAHTTGEMDNQGYVVEPAEITPGADLVIPDGAKIEKMDFTGQNIDFNGVLNWARDELESILSTFLVNPTPNPIPSGYALNSIMDQLESQLVPMTRLAEATKKGTLDEVLHQLMRNPGVSLQLRGKSQFGTDNGKSFLIPSYSAKDIPDSFVLDVEEPPELPVDMLRAVQIFQTGKDSGFWSAETGRAQAGKMSDPLAEEERIQEEAIRNHPSNMAARIIGVAEQELDVLEDRLARAQREGDADIETLALLVIRKRAEVNAKRAELRGEQPGQQQQGPNGVPPSVQPAEERGLENPDVQAQAQGSISSSTQGRPRPAGVT